VSEVVSLESISDCLRAGLPASLATCDPNGIPHVNYVLRVQYLDRERVATSRQAFNYGLGHLDSGSPFSQALVVRPTTGEQFRLDLSYLHTVTAGDEFEAIQANLDAIGSHTGMGPAFRLRGLDVHRVLRCTRVERRLGDPQRQDAGDPLVPLEQFTRRLGRESSYAEAAQDVVDALGDLFGVPYAVLIAPGEIESGTDLVRTAASRRHLIVTANLARARAMAGGELAGVAEARSAAAVPLVVGKDVLGVLYLESTKPSAFAGPTEGLLKIIGAHAAAALAARGAPASQTRRHTPAPGEAAPIQLVYYRADDTVLCDSAYVVKGAPGRILWSMLKAHANSGRTQFSNRELRLDESLGLPAGNDNLEARLLVLRRRLADLDCGVALERVGRGRLELQLQRQVDLTEVPTSTATAAASARGSAATSPPPAPGPLGSRASPR
jgi:hypothetical protein